MNEHVLAAATARLHLIESGHQARRIAIWPRAGLYLELRPNASIRILQGPTAVTVCHYRQDVRICNGYVMFLSLGTHPAMGNQGGCDNVTLTVLHKSHLRPLRKLRASCTNGKGKPERFGQ